MTKYESEYVIPLEPVPHEKYEEAVQHNREILDRWRKMGVQDLDTYLLTQRMAIERMEFEGTPKALRWLQSFKIAWVLILWAFRPARFERKYVLKRILSQVGTDEDGSPILFDIRPLG